MALACDDLTGQRTAENIYNVICKLPTFIEAFVDDDGFLAHLREEVSVEAGIPGTCRVGDWNRGHSGSRGLVHFPPVALDPCQVTQILLAFDRHHGNVARVFSIRMGT